jgi:hypothetical protein
MTKRIAQLIEEHENISKIFDTRDPDVEAIGTSKDSQNIEVLTPDNDVKP